MKYSKLRKLGSCILIIMTLPLLLTGCFNYNDINKVTFSTSIIFDVDDLNQSVVYLDCIKPYRSTNESSDKGRRIIYKGSGKTSLEALEDINRVSSYKLNYSQVRAYIFTENAAREGIKKFLDLINNNSQFQMKPSVFVYYGDVDDLLKTASTDEEYLGLFLNDLVGKDKYNSKSVKANINYYLSNALMGSNVALISSINLKEDAIDKKIEINGASILKDNKLMEKLDVQDNLTYNLLMSGVKSGTLDVTNPQDKESFITLNILKSSVKDDLTYEEGKFKLNKDIFIDVSISEIQGKLTIDADTLDYIKINEQEYINGYAKYIFDNYKKKDLDIFDIKRMAEMYYPNIENSNPLLDTDLEVNTHITIIGTGVAKDSL